MAERLGELLIKRNYITPEQLKKALDEQKLKGGRLESNLVRMGYIKEDELLSFLSAQYRVPSVKLSKIKINPSVVKLIPPSVSKKHFIIPINRVGPKLTLAMADPSDIVVIDEIKFMTGFNVEPVVASESSIREAIEQKVLPLLANGSVKPVIYKTFPLAQASAAHALMETSAHIGKIVLEN